MNLWSELKRRNVFRMAVLYGVSGWLLLQVGDLLFDLMGLPEWSLRLLLAILLLGFPVALIFSWIYELTPEGLKREREIDPDQSVTGHTAKKLDLAVIALIVISLGVFGADRAGLLPSGNTAAPVATIDPAQPPLLSADAPDPGSLAVLPFENRSPNPDNAYFADGIHDDLLTLLAKLGDLTVISRTSVLQYRDTTTPIPDIAAQLGVAHVLEGAVQRAGDQVRVNVQLIEASSDKHLWAETFDRALTAENLFAIQSEIARAIADQLKAQLSDADRDRLNRSPTQSLAAYEQYLKGRQLLTLRTAESLAEAYDLFQSAVTLDPAFGPAYAQLAITLQLQDEYVGTESPVALDQRVANYLERALAIDPNLAEAYASRAGLHRGVDGRDAAEADFLRAIELAPNYAQAYLWYGNFLRGARGQPQQALVMHRRAEMLDPQLPVAGMNVAFDLLALKRLDEALAKMDAVARQFPQYAYARFSRASFYYWIRGDMVAALREYQAAIQLAPNNLQASDQCHVYINLGALETAENCLQMFSHVSPDKLSYLRAHLAAARGESVLQDTLDAYAANPTGLFAPTELAMAYLAEGDAAAALEVLERDLPHVLDESSAIRDPSFPGTLAVAVAGRALQRMGRESEGRALLAVAADLREGIPEIYLPELDVGIPAALGQVEEALAALRRLVDQGWRGEWQFVRASDFVAGIREHPEFMAQMRRIELDMQRQRELAAEEGLL